MKESNTAKLAIAKKLGRITVFVSILLGVILVCVLGVGPISVHVHKVYMSSSTSEQLRTHWNPSTKQWELGPNPYPYPDHEGSSVDIPELVGPNIDWLFTGCGIALFVLGAVSSLCLRIAFSRQNYYMAIAGGIFATLAMLPLGLPLFVLISRRRQDFRQVRVDPV